MGEYDNIMMSAVSPSRGSHYDGRGQGVGPPGVKHTRMVIFRPLRAGGEGGGDRRAQTYYKDFQ